MHFPPFHRCLSGYLCGWLCSFLEAAGPAVQCFLRSRVLASPLAPSPDHFSGGARTAVGGRPGEGSPTVQPAAVRPRQRSSADRRMLPCTGRFSRQNLLYGQPHPSSSVSFRSRRISFHCKKRQELVVAIAPQTFHVRPLPYFSIRTSERLES